MLKVIFFDVYNTLARFWPPVEEIQETVGRRMGLDVNQERFRRGYARADEFFNSENSSRPLAERAPEERDAFFAEYERRILSGAGVEVSRERALEVWREVSKVPKGLALFDDVLPALDALKRDGYRLGALTNIRAYLRKQLAEQGLAERLDYFLTSEEVGAEKPDAAIFNAGLQRANASPEEALHVGDQYQTDVLGARAVGMRAALLDRRDAYPHITDCPRAKDMPGLVSLVRQGAFAGERR